MEKVIGNCGKHPGFNMVNCPMCAIEELKIPDLLKTVPFKLPTDKQLVDFALIFNDGKIEHEKLSDMVAMCQFIIDRLYENGDCTIPSSKEDPTDSEIERMNEQ